MALKPLSHSGESDSDSQILSEINITPLTDIFLVLLIIFMVTSSVMSQLGVDVDLPKATHSLTHSQPEGVIVTLLPNGGIKVNQTQMSTPNWDVLEATLKQAFTKSQSKLVILEGDRKAFLGMAIELMDHARKAGAEKFAIATVPTTR